MSEEKLNKLKEKVTTLQEELKELTPEELEQVFGGNIGDIKHRVNATTTYSPKY